MFFDNQNRTTGLKNSLFDDSISPSICSFSHTMIFVYSIEEQVSTIVKKSSHLYVYVSCRKKCIKPGNDLSKILCIVIRHCLLYYQKRQTLFLYLRFFLIWRKKNLWYVSVVSIETSVLRVKIKISVKIAVKELISYYRVINS